MNSILVKIFSLILLGALITGCSSAATPTEKPQSDSQPTAAAPASTATTENTAPQGGPGNQPQTAPPYDWIDPNTTPPAGALYKLYDTPSRGANTQGSYLISLPASYETDTTRHYPVIYWLHGGFGYQSEAGQIAIPSFAAAMTDGKMPETIIVVPQALPSGWYVNSKDGARPIEDVMIKDLVPHIDATYRTNADAKARGIEGMSMGGYGALHLGLKYPTIFGVISSVAPAIHENITDEPDIRTADTFFGDQTYFEANSPWGLVKNSSAAIVAANPTIRILGGSNDTGLEPSLIKFDQTLTAANIQHTWFEVQGAGHDYTEIYTKSPSDPYEFWKTAFEQAETAQSVMPGGSDSPPQNTAVPTFKDVVYASVSPTQKLDLYIPQGSGPFPVIISIHGGGFIAGDKSSPDAADQLLARGYAIAAIDYRLSGEALAPAQIQDVKTAVRFLRANAEQYNLNPDKFGAWGASAGGSLAALLGTSCGEPALEGAEMGNADQSSCIQAVLDWFGPTDFLQMDKQFAGTSCPANHDAADSPESKLVGAAIQTKPEAVKQVNSITYVSPKAPPFFIEHGTADCNVPPMQGQLLYDALSPAIGADKVTLTFLEGAGHGGAQFFEASNLEKVMAFLDKYLK